MHTFSPPDGYCIEPLEEQREYMRRSVYLASGGGRLEELRGRRVAAVGDYTVRSMLEAGLEPLVAIIDCRSRRSRVACIEPPRGYRVVYAWNPPGRVTWLAWRVVAEAWRTGKTLIVVDGEEDLLALPAILEAPEEALIAYGIPWAGLNIVEASWARPLAEYIVASSRLVYCAPPHTAIPHY